MPYVKIKKYTPAISLKTEYLTTIMKKNLQSTVTFRSIYILE
jgi:hypothetical protein